jgi:exodeoxyribonuclease VII large subunit
VVVRAIFASRIPVVSAIGHEIDVTLSDLVADVRALTPSEAAELVAPAAEELLARLRQMQERAAAAMRFRLSSGRARWEAVARSRVFRRPLQRIEDLLRRLDELETAVARSVRGRLERAARQLDSTAARLESLSPLAVLGRGYSLTQRTSDGRVIRDAGELGVGDQITTRFSRGETISRVEEIRP